MKQTIEKYISENNIINIILSPQKNSEIFTNEIYLTDENSDILQKIILSDKYISVEIYCEFDSYKNIDVLSYTNEIFIHANISTENLLDMIHYPVNLRKLTLTSSYISKIDVQNKLFEKKFLKYIKIRVSSDVNVNDIYKIMEIKSLDNLYLYEFSNNYLSSEHILQILCYIVNNLNKNITIILDLYEQDKTLRKFISLITYNFKIYDNNYIFTYITPAFRKFDNLYDFNLYYQ